MTTRASETPRRKACLSRRVAMFSPFSSSSSAAASSSQRVPSPSALWLEALERLDVDGAVLFADDRAAAAGVRSWLAHAAGELGVVSVLPLNGSGGGRRRRR